MEKATALLEGTTAMTSIDDALADLDLELDGEVVDDAVIADSFTTEEELDDESVGEILNETAAAYESQEITDAPSEPAAIEPAPAKPARQPRAAKAAKPKVVRDLNAIDEQHFQLEASTPADRAAVIALRPGQKKIAEKFDNLFQSLAANRAPSVYVMQCFDLLTKANTLTASDMVAAMKASNSRKGGAYDDGTARSQVGQIMALFAAVKIAHRNGNTLTLNPDSVIAARLTALATAPVAAAA